MHIFGGDGSFAWPVDSRHTPLEPAGRHSEKRNAVSVVLVGVGLNLEYMTAEG